ncbi:DNA-binding transcriptional LysR family regulator [Sphaerotilus hippei]|uniref:DNA-binding transcriptional LysR family regulator n=1 Tax=Sphaerotilus hippei TaxID=744406 RepID=A0A318HH95_9BURK|nr:LysR family transcriptional regulator [Sphaerotilus hippei]PXW99433.1 DNA-binding transcriptional LysR family regulator [Sphaerotilus hippei]
MNQLEAMQIYVQVAELASFTQAATRLGLPRASVSGAVQWLEAHFGTRLLHRTTRRVRMTQDGQVCLERCQDLLADLDDLQTLFHTGPAALSGRLRVDMSLGIARHIVLPRLPEFLDAHPGLHLEISSTDRRVDPVREGFDCVLRVGVLADSSLIARPLGLHRQINLASPAYLARHGTPRTLDDLARHRLVHYLPTLGARPVGFEHVEIDTGEQRCLPMPGPVTVNNSEAYISACLAGLGLIQVPALGVQALVDAGQLVEVLPRHQAAPLPVSLLHAHRRHLPRRVQVFMAWVAQVMAPHLTPHKASPDADDRRAG